jgi:eukaryotic-like serine/threonine-protein kinase
MSDPIIVLNSVLEGRYHIERELGKGGMATVYLADDLRHERKVALKVLKPELAAVVGADRFLIEIKTTANLQHPHILPLFDSGVADSFLFYVMPYVAGETLRDRLEREKQLPVDEAVRIATDVAEALQSAHEQGVIHRDIKPANILLSKGRPIVADFGIALAVSAAGGGRLTETGLSMGTPYYMSPEQASADREPSAASDVYSLGCVLYEMLVGEPPYVGNTAQAVLAKILTEDAPVPIKGRASIPANVDAAVRKALEKLPADRFVTAQDLSEALADSGFRHGEVAVSGGVGGAGFWKPVTFVMTAVALLALTFAWLRPVPTGQLARLDVHFGDMVMAPFEAPKISPDGTTIALAATIDGTRFLHVRRLDEADFQTLPDTEGAIEPAFSPGGEYLVYQDGEGGGLKRVPVAGGTPLPLGPAGREASWGDDGTILYLDAEHEVWRIPEAGGTAVRLGFKGRMPRALPGGRGVLFAGASGIGVFDSEADSVRNLIAEGTDARYVPTGHLLYASRAGVLMAVAFDVGSLELTGDPVAVVDGLSVNLFSGGFSVSQEGTLVYRLGGTSEVLDRSKDRLALGSLSDGQVEITSLPARNWRRPRYSPSGRYVTYSTTVGAGRQIFVQDMEVQTAPTQLTFQGINTRPVWSPDGERIAFASERAGTEGTDLFEKTVSDDTPETLMMRRIGDQVPVDWPSDDVMLFGDRAGAGVAELWTLDPLGDGKPVPYLQAGTDVTGGHVSPDRRRVAYTSNETGRSAVYVRGFPEARQQSRVSPGYGAAPRWSPRGDAVYYWTGGPLYDTLMVAQLSTTPSFQVLSNTPVLATDRIGWDLHPDGERALIVNPVPPGAKRVLVVLNWFEELRRLVPN